MVKYTAAVVTEKGGDFELQQHEIPTPGRDEVVIKVHACGLCHSDTFSVHGVMGGFPIAPGHEVAGEIVAVGEGHRAASWEIGNKVGVGWFGTACNEAKCEACSAGDAICCSKGTVTGIHHNGGYQQYMVARGDACAAIPDGLDYMQAAPLMCAGVTVFNALRHNARPAGSLVAVQGIGGLGHLGIQYANKMGYTVVAISRGTAKKELALQLGAHHYIDAQAGDVSAALHGLGGAAIVLATAFNADAMSQLIDGLKRNGVMVVLGADVEKIKVSPLQLIGQRKSIRGHPSGTARDGQDAMEFANKHGVKVQVKEFPFSKVQEAYKAMVDGQFRVVMNMD